MQVNSFILCGTQIIPKDIFQLIICSLDLTTLGSLSRVSKSFHQIINEDWVWQNCLERSNYSHALDNKNIMLIQKPKTVFKDFHLFQISCLNYDAPLGSEILHQALEDFLKDVQEELGYPHKLGIVKRTLKFSDNVFVNLKKTVTLMSLVLQLYALSK